MHPNFCCDFEPFFHPVLSLMSFLVFIYILPLVTAEPRCTGEDIRYIDSTYTGVISTWDRQLLVSGFEKGRLQLDTDSIIAAAETIRFVSLECSTITRLLLIRHLPITGLSWKQATHQYGILSVMKYLITVDVELVSPSILEAPEVKSIIRRRKSKVSGENGWVFNSLFNEQWITQRLKKIHQLPVSNGAYTLSSDGETVLLPVELIDKWSALTDKRFAKT